MLYCTLSLFTLESRLFSNINVKVNLGISQIWQLDKARAFGAKYYLTGDRLSKLIKHLSLVKSTN